MVNDFNHFVYLLGLLQCFGIRILIKLVILRVTVHNPCGPTDDYSEVNDLH